MMKQPAIPRNILSIIFILLSIQSIGVSFRITRIFTPNFSLQMITRLYSIFTAYQWPKLFIAISWAIRKSKEGVECFNAKSPIKNYILYE